MIRNMVFDMGNVLVRFDIYAHAANIAADPAVQRLLVERVFRSVEWAQMDRGVISIPEGVRRLEAAVPESARPYVRSYTVNWYDHFTIVPGMEGLIVRLKENGYGIYLLSNAAENVYGFIPKLPALQYFDGKFFSVDYGLLKPDARIYQKFLEVFSLEAEECFFTDDMSANVEAAINEGFSSTVFRFDVEELQQAMRQAGVQI